MEKENTIDIIHRIFLLRTPSFTYHTILNPLAAQRYQKYMFIQKQ